jgi:hypothetical protein
MFWSAYPLLNWNDVAVKAFGLSPLEDRVGSLHSPQYRDRGQADGERPAGSSSKVARTPDARPASRRLARWRSGPFADAAVTPP